jgi:hypothetical protein
MYDPVPWLDEYPIQDLVEADSIFPVSITFDAANLDTGDYHAFLEVDTADPSHGSITVPVTMHVVEAGAAMHVAGFQGRFTIDPYGRFVLRMKVSVHDAGHNPLGDVAVDASIWSPVGGPYERTRMTKPASGTASFPWGSPNPGLWRLCVDSLGKTGYAYDPAANDVPACANWNN